MCLTQPWSQRETSWRSRWLRRGLKGEVLCCWGKQYDTGLHGGGTGQ